MARPARLHFSDEDLGGPRPCEGHRRHVAESAAAVSPRLPRLLSAARVPAGSGSR
jgi:hypothetical protein